MVTLPPWTPDPQEPAAPRSAPAAAGAPEEPDPVVPDGRPSHAYRQVAEGFGGGGHRLASGAVLSTTLDDARARVLAAVAAALDAPA